MTRFRPYRPNPHHRCGDAALPLRPRVAALAACLAAALASSAARAQDVLVNGDFEQSPACANGLWETLVAGSASLPGWTIAAGDVDVVCGHWTAAAGARSLDLNGYLPGTITQTFATVPGARYRLSFSLGGNPWSAPAVKRVAVRVAGQSTELAFDNTGTSPSDMRWQRKAVEFTAPATSASVEFRSLTAELCEYTGQCSGPALDAVSVDFVALPVAIDVKPGSYPNAIHLADTGSVPVAVFSTSGFDATRLDVSTLTLEGAPVRLVRGKGLLASAQDVNGDGLADLVVQFDRGELALSPGSTTAALTGSTLDGVRVEGLDSVVVTE